MSEFKVGQRVKVVDSVDPDLFPNGSTGVIVGKDDYSSQAWWVKFDRDCGAEVDSGNGRYTLHTGIYDNYGVWSVNDWEMEVCQYALIDEIGYIETGRKAKKEWEPDQVREDVDLMQSIRDACGG